MRIEHLPLDRLKPYPANPRTIPQEAVDAVARSIRAFGFRQPIVVDAEHVIIAGHTRHLAAHQLGMVTVPVHIVTDLSAEQVAALRLADNQTSTLTSWDHAALDKELAALQAVSSDLCAAAGFPLEVEALLEAIREEEPYDGDRATQERREKQVEKLANSVEKVRAIVEADKKVNAVVIPLDGRPEALVLADPSFTDFIAELRRAVDAGEDSPLAAVLREVRPL
ncbi:ParB N-terminal domain-containing protein [Verrucomicrobiota bacterium]